MSEEAKKDLALVAFVVLVVFAMAFLSGKLNGSFPGPGEQTQSSGAEQGSGK